MKRLDKFAAEKIFAGAKKILRKNSYVKSLTKNIIDPYIAAGIEWHDVDRGYSAWVRRQTPDHIDICQMKVKQKNFPYQPLISIIVPTYNTDKKFLTECIDSVLSQAYENWELCIVDDASVKLVVRKILREYSQKDTRIKVKFLKKNHHIANATNEGVAMAKGEFVALLDHDDMLWPHALYEVVKALNNDKEIDFLYTDEDKITANRHDHDGPFFKPDWNPDFLHSVNYITHMAVIRKTIYEKIGGERSEYNGAQDWDLFLRIARETQKIYHIPKVVYSWRIHDRSTAKDASVKPYVTNAQKQVIEDDLASRGYDKAYVMQDDSNNQYWRVVYPPVGDPLVSIIIPTKDQYEVAKRCIDSIYKKTTYKNFEIVLVDTGSTDIKVLKWYKRLQKKHQNIKIIDWTERPFSYARSCNKGAEVASGELLLMLNNDTEVMTADWIEQLCGEAQRSEIGAVGCLLLYPDGKHIQHAGVGIGLGGVAANSFTGMEIDRPMTQTQHLMVHTRHNITAVTAACMAIRKDIFEEVGGFDETFRVTYNDVDLCLRLVERGYQNVYTPYVRLKHHESLSLGRPEDTSRRDTVEFEKAKKQFIATWKKYVEYDPNINPNLSRVNASYDLDLTRD